MRKKTSDLSLSPFEKIVRRNTLTLLRPTRVITVLFLMSFCPKSLALETQTPVVLKLNYSHRAMYSGFQSSFSINIHQNGKVHYQNTSKEVHDADSVPQNRYAQLTEEQVKGLVDDFLSLPLKELAKYDGKKGSDSPVYSVHLQLEDTEISISNSLYYWATLDNLKKYLAKELKAWLCPPKGDEDYSEDCPEGLPKGLNFFDYRH